MGMFSHASEPNSKPVVRTLGTILSLADFRHWARQPHGVYEYNVHLIRQALLASGTTFRENDRVLDVDCGQCQYMVDHLWQTAQLRVGLDFHLAWLIRNKDIDVHICGDMHQLPFPDNSFNIVVSVDTIEHTFNPETFLQEVFRVLTPGGTALIFTPHLFGYKNLIAKIGNDVVFKLFHQLAYRLDLHYGVSYRANSVGTYKRLAKKNGWTVREVFYIAEISHFFYRSQLLSTIAFLYNDLVVRLRMPWLLNYMIVILNKP